MTLSGLRVLVTAGAGGIGRAIAERLIAEGARVHVCDVDESRLADFAHAFPGHSATRADVAVETEVEALFAEMTDRLGGLDALVNNAGIPGPTAAVEDVGTEEWRRCLDVCLTGQFLCARRAVPLLKAAGGGAILAMSSAAGRFGYAFRTPYAAAKWGVVGLALSLARELGPDNIRVNALLPGIVEGPRIEAVIAARARRLGIGEAEMEARLLERTSLRRMVTAADVAGVAAFLLSPAGHSISGQTFGIDAGLETL